LKISLRSRLKIALWLDGRRRHIHLRRLSLTDLLARLFAQRPTARDFRGHGVEPSLLIRRVWI
jgi:hypothetical protein